ncbi:MAG: hypothetical protein IPK82_07400 [Polyangiaceae bacterium]|nr:hypothetical protein [Polyangiaceae bacterium]
MAEPLTLTIVAPFQRSLANGGTITFNHSRVSEGVWMRHWDPQGNPLELNELTYEEYEEFRQAHPELNMPELKPPEGEGEGNGNGNTVGRVVGETPAAEVSAEEANPPVAAETPGEASLGTKVLDGVQIGLDVVGLIPGAGEIADLTNAGISALRGDYVGAGLSLASAIPFAGWFGTGAKFARRGIGLADEAAAVAKRAEEAAAAAKRAEEAAAAAKRAEEAAAAAKRTEEASAAAKQSDAGAKQADEAGANNAQVKRAKKLKCGDNGSYDDLKKSSGDNQFDRDHVPSKASLIERAKQLAAQKGIPFTKEMAADITNLADAIAIPKSAHQKVSDTYGQRGKPLIAPDAADLRKAAVRDLNKMLGELRNTDPRCFEKYKKFAKKLTKAFIDNKDHYDEFLREVIGG